ncbi:hypothetical protein ICL81_01620 [Leucobacter sp. cx-328]|uniref:hypothetical protein n=1 Tax=unclassified Leucobacter TaxID=2621730 RepID=UPI00165D7AED|nr:MULTISPECIES: hypothetical protein [unclassified Leucobacter]MBC9943228.1 hypothetical protein [Leucobacter sp. cx-328]
MKRPALLAAALAASATLLVAGCSLLTANDGQASPKPENVSPEASEEVTAPAQEEAQEVEAPSYSEDELLRLRNIPLQVGEYTLLKQPEAKDSGTCSDQIPIRIEDAGWHIRYASEEAI